MDINTFTNREAILLIWLGFSFGCLYTLVICKMFRNEFNITSRNWHKKYFEKDMLKLQQNPKPNVIVNDNPLGDVS